MVQKDVAGVLYTSEYALIPGEEDSSKLPEFLIIFCHMPIGLLKAIHAKFPDSYSLMCILSTALVLLENVINM